MYSFISTSLPTYAMTVFKLPHNLCNQINAIIRKIWWNCKEKMKIFWTKWSTLCERKAEGGLGFRDIEAFNDAMLTKQWWRLMQNKESLVFKILKAKYFPNGDLNGATLAGRPSYTWRSIMEAKWVIEKGTRSLIGNGNNTLIWGSPWLPRPHSFRVVTPLGNNDPNMKVCSLIDNEKREWKRDLIDDMFLPVDAELIKSMPLGFEDHDDKLLWSYTSDGTFTVKSAYHLIMKERKHTHEAGSSYVDHSVWRRLWKLNVPPRIKIFLWRAAINSLPTRVNIGKRLKDFNENCPCCGAREESDLHIFLACPIAGEVWIKSELPEACFMGEFKSTLDWFEEMSKKLDDYNMGLFAAVLWAIWNTRNKIQFGEMGSDWSTAGKKAISFVKSYVQIAEKNTGKGSRTPPYINVWKPPGSGTWKLNCDVAQRGVDGVAWGFCIRDYEGEVVAAGYKVGPSWNGSEFEEAKGLYWSLLIAWESGYRSIIVENDCW